MIEHMSFNGTILDDALFKGGSIPAVQLLMNPPKTCGSFTTLLTILKFLNGFVKCF